MKRSAIIQLVSRCYPTLVLCALFSTIWFSTTLHAQLQTESEQVIIVLDASGSMWGQIDKEPKISIAKDVVTALVKDWDGSIDLGLSVYGHRRKGDCEDIELVMKPAPVNLENFNQTLKSISPKGKTPLSKAVVMAAEELKYTEQRATVILVSDGIETCDYDPCEVARKLEAAGIDFTAHVIGFDVNEEEAKKQLSCLAEGTGGKFMTASNASALKDSLDEAIKEIKLSKNDNVELVAVLTPGGEPLTDVAWNVIDSNNSSAAYGRGPKPKYSLQPGRYTAKVHSLGGKATAEKEFEVIEGETSRHEVVLAQEGVIKLVAVSKPKGDALTRVAWNVYELNNGAKGQSVAYGRGAQPEYTLMPGKYLAYVYSIGGQAKAEQEIEVFAGKKNTAEVILALEGILKLVAVNKPGGDPLDAVSWNVHSVVTETQKSQSVAYGRGPEPEYTLLPGKYLAKVHSVHGKAKVEQEVEVIAGKKNTVEVVLAQEGIVKLLAVNEAGSKALSEVTWKITTLPTEMEKAELVAYGRGAQPEYTLLPGKYSATVRSVKGSAEAEQKIEVIAGKKTQIEILMPAEGMIELAAVTKEGRDPLTGVSWKILSIVEPDSMEEPTLVTYGKGPTPMYRLLPGKYLAQVKSIKGMAEAEQVVEVLPLKKNRVEVLIPEEGEIELSATFESGEKPNKVYWELYSIVAPDSMEKPTRLRYGGGKTPRFRMLPGRYTARATYSNEKFEKVVEVRPGQVARETITLDSEKSAG